MLRRLLASGGRWGALGALPLERNARFCSAVSALRGTNAYPRRHSPLAAAGLLSVPARATGSSSQATIAAAATKEALPEQHVPGGGTDEQPADSDMAQSASKGPSRQELLANVTLVTDRTSALRALEVLMSEAVRNRFIACDTEVVNIDIKNQSPVGNGRVICFSVYCGEDVDFGSGSKLWVDCLANPQDTLMVFKEFFEHPSILKVWHNYGFDRHVLYNHGIDVKGLGGDTMHMARLWHSARAHEGGYSLEALSEELLGKRKIPIKELFGRNKPKKDGSLGKVIVLPELEELQRDAEIFPAWVDYATYDAVATWKLRNVLEENLRAMPWTVGDAGRDGVEGKNNSGKTMYHFYLKYYRPFADVLTDMERAGVYLRIKDGFLSSIRDRALRDREDATRLFLAWAEKQCPDARFMNVSSDAQKQQLFFAPFHNERGKEVVPKTRIFHTENVDGYIEPGKTKPKKLRPFVLTGLGMPLTNLRSKSITEGGKPAVSLAVLRELAGSDLDTDKPRWGAAHSFFKGEKGEEACRAIGALCRVSAIDTLLSNFIEPLLDGIDSRGRVHCSLNLNTETGRLSSRRPNLQNQPALEKDVYKLRDAFGCDPEENTIFIVADYGQLELRILAHMANCSSMIEAFRAGGDFHSRTAIGMYPEVARAVEKNEVLLEWDHKKGPPPAPLLKDVFAAERRRAKTLNFSIAYGKTAMGLARDWNVSVEDAKETLARWYADRPEVKRWQELTIEQARRTQATRTLMGRYRPLPDINSPSPQIRAHAERAAINTPIQGGAADVVMKAMLVIHANQRLRELGWRMVLQIHDELILEGPRETLDEAMVILKHCMVHPFARPLRVDLVVDARADVTWYACK